MADKLKSKRVVFGITQDELAKMLGVSQQTVARWEADGNTIPTKYLRDLAVTFGGKIEDFLGGSSDSKVKPLRAESKPHRDADTPYGTVEIDFGAAVSPTHGQGSDDEGAKLSYPVSEGEEFRLRNQIYDGEDAGAGIKWVEFRTLDLRWVFVNVSATECIEWIGDDVEAMPHFEHEEVYKAAKNLMEFAAASGDERASDDYPYTESMLEKAQGVLEGLEEQGVDPGDWFDSVTYEFLSGERGFGKLVGEETFSEILSTLGTGELVNQNAFIEVETEGYYRSKNIRVGTLRLVELPLLQLTELSEKD